jgi:hypothetical protein
MIIQHRVERRFRWVSKGVDTSAAAPSAALPVAAVDNRG